jgi:hypothetical protein
MSPPLSDHSNSENPPDGNRKHDLCQILFPPTLGLATMSKTKDSFRSSVLEPRQTVEGTEAIVYCTPAKNYLITDVECIEYTTNLPLVILFFVHQSQWKQ